MKTQYTGPRVSGRHRPAGRRAALVMATLALLASAGVCVAGMRVAERASAVNAPFEISGFEAGMLALYEDNRQRGLANLITPDLLLIAYSQIRQQRIEKLEQQRVMPALAKLLAGLRDDIDATLQQPDGSADRAAAESNRAFIGILLSLLGDEVQLPPAAQREQQLILSASGVEMSPVWGVKIDYSQFQPRGRYSDTATMQQYFRAVRYASGALFLFHPSAATGVTAERAQQNASQAADLVARLQKPQIQPHYRAIDDALAWQFGAPDDLTAADVAAVLHSRDCGDSCPASLAEQLTSYAVEHQRLPRIVGTIVDANQLAAGDSAERALAGWRLLASRLSADNIAMQQLLYSGGDALVLDCPECASPPANSTSFNGREVKGYPSMLEIMALLGSEEAADRLDQRHWRAYSGYADRSSRAAATLQQAHGLQAAQFDVIRQLLQPAAGDASASAVELDALSAASGFWIWQKYLNLLYQKQPYTLTGRNLQLAPEQDRPGAMVVGPEEAYASLLALLELHRQHDADPAWDVLSGLVERCLQIRRASSASAQDNQFLNNLDRELKKIGIQHDQPVVVDIHTNAADSQVVEVATLYPRVYTHGAARGAGFQVSEFKVSLDKRLTVENWRRVLSALARRQR